MKGYPSPVVQDGQVIIGSTTISINKIRLDQYIGSGVNGFVFSGQDIQLDRRVAVKVWPPRKDRPQGDGELTDKVLGEVRNIAKFKDKGIASIFSIDRLSGSGWIYTVMEYVEGDPLVKIRAGLDAQKRRWIWQHVFNALDTAERAGVFHGDVHDGNVMVTSFMGDVTLIDFGTSILLGERRWMYRHAKKVNEFAQLLLPELKNYLPPFDIEEVVTHEYATIAVNQWVESATELQKLEEELADLSAQDIDRRLRLLAAKTSSTHLNIYEPVTQWLTDKSVSSEHLKVYSSASKEQLTTNWGQRERLSFRSRLVPPTKSWMTTLEWLNANT